MLDRVQWMDAQAADLRASAGAGTVVGNLTGALTAVFGSVAVAMVPLMIFRDELRARLRRTWPTGIPVLAEAGAMIASYLTAERELGRIAPDADIDMLAPTLIGAGHLLFADRKGAPPDDQAIRRMVTTVMFGVLREPPP